MNQYVAVPDVAVVEESSLWSDFLSLFSDLQNTLVKFSPLMISHLTRLGHGRTDIPWPLWTEVTDHTTVLGVLMS